jgi:cytochrome c7-like protein/class III cytochrome C family protein
MLRYAGAALVTGLVAAAWIVILPPSPVRQPIAFPHAKHQGVGCTVCHRGAATTARAAIPNAALCAKCHSTIPGRAATAAASEPIAWVQVTQLPSHVMFSHRRHVTLGKLECESCHGQMKERTAPLGAAPIRLEMKTCLSCHSREGAAEDCAACHR